MATKSTIEIREDFLDAMEELGGKFFDAALTDKLTAAKVEPWGVARIMRDDLFLKVNELVAERFVEYFETNSARRTELSVKVDTEIKRYRPVSIVGESGPLKAVFRVRLNQ